MLIMARTPNQFTLRKEMDYACSMGPFRTLKSKWRTRRAMMEMVSRHVTPRPHCLGAPLIVSLTSYPKRYDVLHLTLTCLLCQTIMPDEVILWISDEDFDQLPDQVLMLQERGLKIYRTQDLRSFNKIIPALRRMPDAYIATADDDIYYPADWLEGLVKTAVACQGRIVAHRVHRILYDAAGQMESYERWTKNILQGHEGQALFATGVGGVLYPPQSLHADVLREDLFMTLCPHGDDLWLYWMAQRQGSLVCHVGPKPRIIEWPGSQQNALRTVNRGTPNESGNDHAIAALTKYFSPNGIGR
ncbi:glycosyltransferase [Loktanella sp. DJP18]|uniref:glycosyltransferase n=1 Tax=Loktanella sp. DJP18 TaxID=3409788 RepID=UPI003BB4F84D